jgi:hypothetical protein
MEAALLPGGSRRRGLLLVGADPIALVAIFLVGGTGELVAARARLLILEARTALAQHPEIMVRELQIIFGVDPVALHLGVARQRLVLLEKLGRVAARAIVDTVAAILTAVGTVRPGRARPTATTATAAVLPIIDQLSDVLVTGGIGSPLPFPGPPRNLSGLCPKPSYDARRPKARAGQGPHPPCDKAAEKASVTLEVVASGRCAMASRALSMDLM